MVSTKKLVDTMLLQTDYPINVDPPDAYQEARVAGVLS